MGASGRSLKLGLRYPGGKLKPEASRATGSPGAQVRRMFDEAKRGALDPRLGTAIGWLRMHDALTDRQFAAAEAYAKLRGRHDSAISAPRRSAASPAYGKEVKRASGIDYSDRQLSRIRKAHDQMVESMVQAWPLGTIVDGKMPRSAAAQSKVLLDRVCVDDQHPSAWELTALCRSLNGLAKHFGI